MNELIEKVATEIQELPTQDFLRMKAEASLPEGYEITTVITSHRNFNSQLGLCYYISIDMTTEWSSRYFINMENKLPLFYAIKKQSNDNWKQILKDREREQQTYTDKANEKTRKDFYNDCL